MITDKQRKIRSQLAASDAKLPPPPEVLVPRAQRDNRRGGVPLRAAADQGPPAPHRRDGQEDPTGGRPARASRGQHPEGERDEEAHPEKIDARIDEQAAKRAERDAGIARRGEGNRP